MAQKLEEAVLRGQNKIGVYHNLIVWMVLEKVALRFRWELIVPSRLNMEDCIEVEMSICGNFSGQCVALLRLLPGSSSDHRVAGSYIVL